MVKMSGILPLKVKAFASPARKCTVVPALASFTEIDPPRTVSPVATDVSKLPLRDVNDMSCVFVRTTKPEGP